MLETIVKEETAKAKLSYEAAEGLKQANPLSPMASAPA